MFRRISSRELRDIVLAVVFTLGILWLLWLIWGLAGKEETARKAAATAHAELMSLQSRAQAIQGNLTELGTPRGQDAALRTAFDVARPGEEVIIVVPSSVATTSATTSPSFWSRLFNWF